MTDKDTQELLIRFFDFIEKESKKEDITLNELTKERLVKKFLGD